jgi:hypothetical protein
MNGASCFKQVLQAGTGSEEPAVEGVHHGIETLV